MRFWLGDQRQTRIMRYAIGVTLSVAIAFGIDWPLAFLMPVLTAVVLAMPLPSPTLPSSLKNMLQTLVGFSVGAIYTVFLLPYPLIYIPMLGLGLFHIYYLLNRGAPFWLVLMLLLAVLLLPMLGNTAEGLALGVAMGFIGSGWLTVAMIILAHTLVPDPPGGPERPARPGFQRGYSAPAAHTALKSAIVVLPIASLFLILDLSSLLLVMVFTAIFTLQPDLSKGRDAGMNSLISTLFGGFAAFVFYHIMVAVPEYYFLIALMLLTTLLFGRQAFSSSPTAKYAGSAFVALLVLFSSSLGEDANFTSNFIMRVVFISLAILYVVSALRVVERYWPHKQAVSQV
jgi:uncharacterized membrane protein YccC